MDWERIIAENEYPFERLREQASRLELAPDDVALLTYYAEMLEAAYLLGTHEVPSDQNTRKRQLFEKARQCIRYASQTDVTFLRLHVEVALGLDDVVLADQYASEAQRLVESGIEISHDVRQDILVGLGLVRQAQENHKQAAEFFVRAIEAAPDSETVPSLVKNAALAFSDAGLHSEALAYLQRVVANEPDAWFFQQMLAEAYERAGGWDDAIEQYKDQLGRAKERKAVEHLSFRIGFCEARRDNKRRRPTGAPPGMGGALVELTDESGEHSGLTEHEKTRMQLIKTEQHLARLLEEKVQPAFSAVIETGRPYSNLAHLRQALEACKEYIWWADPHFQSRALDQLVQAADRTRVGEIRILSLSDVVDQRDRKNWHLFVQEMRAKGIQAEWRTTPKRQTHDRFIVGANIAFNVPPVNSLFKGDYAEITQTPNRPPFEHWWHEAKPI